jgi:DNA-directed RNA polymerase specialized sigma24 family protein
MAMSGPVSGAPTEELDQLTAQFLASKRGGQRELPLRLFWVLQRDIRAIVSGQGGVTQFGAEVDDVVQDVLLNVTRRPPTQDTSWHTLRAFVRTATKRKVIDYQRAARWRNRWVDRPPEDLVDAGAKEPAHIPIRPEDVRLLLAGKPSLRRFFELRCRHPHLAVSELARLLNTKESNIYQLSRRLRELVSGYLSDRSCAARHTPHKHA